ncbi:hypothetical protein BAE44_0008946 [Dichanthelium oligosanthes]|uniref:C2H2-type domain-containing protein n=1 Tax=Dichanthelium oligosanthes TaxID=888268 RepID=A0A1E5VY38_9POAL|nr:hypothetical protein BAE44_0008946 [Dichanthelium oligosanthes]
MAVLWWASLKKSLTCKSRDSCDVIKLEDSRGGSARGNKKSFLPPPSLLPRSGCSRSISNLRDVIHSQYGGSRRHKPAVASRCESPRSIESTDVLNPMTQDVLLAAGGPAVSGRDLRVGGDHCAPGPGLSAWAIGGAAPLSPLLTRCSTARLSRRNSQREMSPLRRESGAGNVPAWVSSGVGVLCDRCGGRYSSNDALESHHLVYHAGKRHRMLHISRSDPRIRNSKEVVLHFMAPVLAVTELVDGDTASKVVELIFKVGWPNPGVALDRIERVVKVHNMDKSVDRFKEYMEEVKGRAAKVPSKHPRCIADGNELLQFHGTTVSCSLGASGSHSICASSTCNVCRILRHGFSATRESRDGGGVGVFTTSTSKRALDRLEGTNAGGGEAGAGGVRHALIVCRAIAGRIHRPLENPQDVAGQPGFDSVAGQVGAESGIDELYLLNPSALLPCFVVICKA